MTLNLNPVKSPRKTSPQLQLTPEKEEQIMEEEIQKLKRRLAPKFEKPKKIRVDERESWEKFLESANKAIQLIPNQNDGRKIEIINVSFKFCFYFKF